MALVFSDAHHNRSPTSFPFLVSVFGKPFWLGFPTSELTLWKGEAPAEPRILTGKGGRGSCRAKNIDGSGDRQVGKLGKNLAHQRFAFPQGSISEHPPPFPQVSLFPVDTLCPLPRHQAIWARFPRFRSMEARGNETVASAHRLPKCALIGSEKEGAAKATRERGKGCLPFLPMCRTTAGN